MISTGHTVSMEVDYYGRTHLLARRDITRRQALSRAEIEIEIKVRNWPFPSFKNSQFQNEAYWKTVLAKMSFICMRIKNIFISIALHLASL